MTIIENILRIKEGVKNAFTSIANKGVTVPANSRAEDLAELIDVISTGTDVSDTTATASKVLNDSYFYNKNGERVQGKIPIVQGTLVTLTADTTAVSQVFDSDTYYIGRPNEVKVNPAVSLTPTASGTNITSGIIYKASAGGLAITTPATLTPSASGVSILNGTIYKANASGYAVNSLYNITPSTTPTAILSGSNYHMNGDGYVCSKKSSTVNYGSFMKGVHYLDAPKTALTIVLVLYDSATATHYAFYADRTIMKYYEMATSSSGANNKAMSTTVPTNTYRIGYNATDGWMAYESTGRLIGELFYSM